MTLGRWGFAALLLHATLIQVVTFLLRPATTYQALELGAPVAALGAIGASFAIVPLALAIPVGAVTDRVGSRVVLVAGSFFALLGSAGLFVAGSTIVGLVVSTAVLGAGHLGCIVGQQSVVAHAATRGRLDTMFGYYTFAASLGQALGPLVIAVAGGTAVQPDTQRLFIVGVGLSGVLLLSSAFIPGRRAPRTEADPGGDSWWQILKLPGVIRAIATSGLIVAAVDLSVVYIPALGAERGLSAAAVGALLATRAVASMISRLFLGRSAARIGRARLMTISIIVAAVSLIAFAAPIPEPLLFLVSFALGLGLGVGQPLTMSWVTEQVPPNRRGTVLAMRLAGNRLSQVSIPAILGVTALGLGAGAVLGVTGGLLAATLVLLRGVRLDEDQ